MSSKHYLNVGASRGIGLAVAEHLAWTIHETSDYRAGLCACREFREGAEYRLYFDRGA